MRNSISIRLALSAALILSACSWHGASAQDALTGGVSADAMTGDVGDITSGGGEVGGNINSVGLNINYDPGDPGIIGPVGLDMDNQMQPLFTLPNFQGDTREEDSHYNTLHQYPYPAWDSYRQVLNSYCIQARQYASEAYPAPPYSTYNYLGADMTPGPGGMVTPPAGLTGDLISGSSNVSESGDRIHGTNHDGVAVNSDREIGTTQVVTGNIITPLAPGLVDGQ